MDEELKQAIETALKGFKESLPKFVDEQSLNNAFKDFKIEQEKAYGEAIAKGLETLETAVKAQGETLQAIKNVGGEKKESLADLMTANKEQFDNMIKSGGQGQIVINTTIKSVSSSAMTNPSDFYLQGGVGEIKRGMPYVRDLLPKVFLASGTQGSVKWWEQTSVTNNAANVAEVRVPGSESAMTWEEKTLSGKRIFDFVKIGVDALKDFAFVQGEIQRLVERNMKLKENDQLINGVGTGNEIKGLNAYANTFTTTGIEIVSPNAIDLANYVKNQITTDMLGAAMPNVWLASNNDIVGLRTEKDSMGRYLFENWALGYGINVAGMNLVENPLQATGTMLFGDFTLATLYIWDDLVIEIAQIEDDKKKGLTTIMAYQRENLRIQDVDYKAFVKITSVSDTLAAITKTQA